MRDVTAVESSWLVELAPHFYKQAKVGQRKKPRTSDPYYMDLTVVDFILLLHCSVGSHS